MIALPHLDIDTPFPPVSNALDEPNGLLAFGADLSAQRLFSAYSQGIFPWFSDDEPLLWWSPNPRSIIELNDFVCAKSLRKLAKQKRYSVTLNKAFDDVIHACASIPRINPNTQVPSQDTWITDDMRKAYGYLHSVGLAHSVEVWEHGTLVGGLYGVGVGKVYCGESMFHKRSNTSKLAMLALVEHMQRNNMAFIDCQLPTEHLASLGASTISRDKFVAKLQRNNHTLTDGGTLHPSYIQQWRPQVITP